MPKKHKRERGDLYVRKFSGKKFDLSDNVPTKKSAKRTAEAYRSRGRRARIVKSNTGGYAVYIDGKRR